MDVKYKVVYTVNTPNGIKSYTKYGTAGDLGVAMERFLKHPRICDGTMMEFKIIKLKDVFI